MFSRVRLFATPWSQSQTSVLGYLPEFAQIQVHWVGDAQSTFTARGLKLYLGNPDEKGLTSLAWFTESEHDAINSAARNVQITLSPTDAWNPTTANRAAARWRKTVLCVCVCVCVGGGAVKWKYRGWHQNSENSGHFPGGPEADTLSPQCRGSEFEPWSGTCLHVPQRTVHTPQRRSQIPQAATKTCWVKEIIFFFFIHELPWWCTG